MPTFSIESNGRLEKTAVYYNGDQLGGVREIFLNLDEEGTFDAIIQYQSTKGELMTKQIFADYLEDLKTVPPSFTEDEAEFLQLLTVESSGDIETTNLFLNEQPLEGVVSIFLHIKSGGKNKGGIRSLFQKDNIPEHDEFRAEITFRNEDETIETEGIF